MPDLTPLRVVVVGAGRFGALHIRSWIESGAQIVGVVDIDEARLAVVADRYRIHSTGIDAVSVIAATRPDLVVVASDESTHVELALTALEHGAHVLLEKPYAVSSHDAEKLTARAVDVGRQVIAAHISRFALPYEAIRQAITARSIGTLWSLRLRRDFSRDWYGGFGSRIDPVWESCIHDIDLALYFTDSRAVRVSAFRSEAAAGAAPSIVSALIELANGVLVTIETAWSIPPAAPQTESGALELPGSIVGEVEAHGSAGIARQRLLSDAFTIWTDSGAWSPNPALWPIVDGRVGGALRAEIDYTSAVVRGERPNDRMPMQQAVEGVRVAEAIVQALRTGAVVTLESR